MAIYYLVYILMKEVPVLIGIDTNEDKAYDILKGLVAVSEEEKWIQRIKTDERGNVC